MVKDLKKIAEETNMTITEMEEMILTASINNQMVNTTNITQISENLQYMVQLDQYKGKGNRYMEENIQEIQELYIDKEREKEEGKVEDEEVILIKPYKVSTATTLGGLPHEPYFIAIDNMEQIIIGPSKKIVAIYVIGELAVMV